jgi:hypothetical protein
MNALKGPLPDDWSALGGQLEVLRLSQNFLNGEAREPFHSGNFGVKFYLISTGKKLTRTCGAVRT